MLKFIPAGILKKKFVVLGHFYSVCMESAERIECASVFELASKKAMSSGEVCLTYQSADAIFIMMNPGSSTPFEEVDNVISGDNISQLEISLVHTKPDSTQYQIMRIMHFCHWNHVRIVNISDLRDSKGSRFAECYSDLEYRTGYRAHSLFTKARKKELNLKLKRKSSAPIVCAWGVNNDLEPLIKRCLKMLGEKIQLFGLLKKNTENKYFHPLPTLQKDKEEWVNKMVMQLNG